MALDKSFSFFETEFLYTIKEKVKNSHPLRVLSELNKIIHIMPETCDVLRKWEVRIL